jgi:hypothetical protein
MQLARHHTSGSAATITLGAWQHHADGQQPVPSLLLANACLRGTVTTLLSVHPTEISAIHNYKHMVTVMTLRAGGRQCQADCLTVWGLHASHLQLLCLTFLACHPHTWLQRVTLLACRPHTWLHRVTLLACMPHTSRCLLHQRARTCSP